MNWRICAIAAVLAVTGGYQTKPPTNAAEHATVQGIVTDPTGGSIRDAELHFTSNGRETVTRSSSDGTYEVNLTPGVYTVRVTLPAFCDGRRGEFSARAGATIYFTFPLIVCGWEDGYTIDADGHTTPFSGTAPGGYAWEELPAVVPNGPKPMVLYGKREEKDGSIRYSTLVFANQRYSAVYTYDLQTVRATTFWYSPTDHSIVGTGNVLWQEGKTTKIGTRIEIKFLNGEPQIQLTDFAPDN